MAARTAHLRSLEGARGAAALGVLAYHTTQLSNGHGYLEAATSRFWLGVPLFFVLSGFLLFRPFAHATLHGLPTPSIRRYARNRLLRIAPAFWVVVSVSILLLPPYFHLYPAVIAAAAVVLWVLCYVRRLGTFAVLAAAAVTGLALYLLAQHPFYDVTWPAFANYTLTYIPFAHYSGISGPAWSLVVGPSWSLCIEIAFYCCLPLIAIVAARFASRGESFEARSRRLALALVPALPLGLAYMWLSAADAQSVSLTAFIDEFAVGMLLAVALERWPTVSPRTGRVLLTAGIALGVAANLDNRLGPRDPYGNGSGLIFARLMVLAFALVLASVLMRDQQTILGRALSSRVLVAAGTISYGIYLWHFLIIDKLNTTALWWTEGTNVALVLALTVAIATVSWFALESPLLRLKKDPGSPRRVGRAPSLSLEPSRG